MANSARFDFSGAAVLVTGGSNGIGNAIARGFRDSGASVTVTGTRADGAYDSDLSGMAYRALDVRDMASVDELAAAVQHLDVLVNSAGRANPGGRTEYDLDVFENVLNINLTGAFRVSTAMLPRLKANGGAVLNIASVSSFIGMAGAPGYGASKAAIAQLTKTLAAHWVRYGIRVNAIAPGFVRTQLAAPVEAYGPLNDRILKRMPMGRWAEPEEMAGAALFLCSDAAGYITGTILPVDGGFCGAL